MCVLCPVLVVCLYICAWQPCWISSQNVIAMNIAMNPRRTMLPVVMLMISSPWRKSRGLAALTLTVNLHSFGVTFYILYISITNIFYIFTYLSPSCFFCIIPSQLSWSPSQNHLCGHLITLTFLLNHPSSSHGHHHPETIQVVIALPKLVIISFSIISLKLDFAIFSISQFLRHKWCGGWRRTWNRWRYQLNIKFEFHVDKDVDIKLPR